MKFLDFRKYFFSYVYIVIGILLLCSAILSLKLEPAYIPHDEPTNFHDYRFYPYTTLMFGSLFLYIYCCFALLIEIVIRSLLMFFLKKKQSFSLTKNNMTSTTIFYVLFIIASLPLLIALIAYCIH